MGKYVLCHYFAFSLHVMAFENNDIAVKYAKEHGYYECYLKAGNFYVPLIDKNSGVIWGY